mgnify:CR=1 FL=1
MRALLGLAHIAKRAGDEAASAALLRQALRFAGRRSLLEEYVETVLEIAGQRPTGAPVELLLTRMLAYVGPVNLEAAIHRLENALHRQIA